MQTIEYDSSKPVHGVTVVIIMHGDPPKIQQTIDSIRNQSFPSEHTHLMILDDGTSPAARSKLDEIGVMVFDMPNSCTISYAKNFAMEHSNDELIFFLDDRIVLERDAIAEGMRVIRNHPLIAGVCGQYRSRTFADYNILRDIKRESIYGKSAKERFITLKDFTTFSTGMGIVNRRVLKHMNFPSDIFSNGFGGEDIPGLISALHEGHRFAYTPRMRGTHEHNLTLREFLRKIEIEVRGRFCIFYWAIDNPEMQMPYLHGFLNFPYVFTISLPAALLLLPVSPIFLLLPGCALAYETLLSFGCLKAPRRWPYTQRIKASLYVLASDVLSIVCLFQYLISPYKRPYSNLGWRRFLQLNKMFIIWELKKYGLRS